MVYVAHPNVASWRLLERELDIFVFRPRLAQVDLHLAHAGLVLPDLCAMATYAPTYMPTYAPRYAPTYLPAALNMDIPMLKGRPNKTMQANIKV